MNLISVKDYVKLRKEEMKKEIISLLRRPKLVIIQMNDDVASNSYVKGKLKDAEELGIEAKLMKLDESLSEEQLFDIIDEINNDKTVDGLIVQLPLPKHISEIKVKERINPKKDVDGFHPLSKFKACTPKGIISYLTYLGFDFVSKNVVIIGRSNIVGRPLAKLLLDLSMNVTVLHSKTSIEDRNFYLKHADLVVTAVGKPHLLTNDIPLKKETILVDVGISRLDGHLVGDIEPRDDVLLQTPVPGGVGLLTRLSLMENVLEAYKDGISR